MPQDANVVDIQDLSHLSKMSAEEYQKVRKDEAKRRNLHVRMLDAMVQNARKNPEPAKDEDKPIKDSKLQLSLDLLTTRLRTYCVDNEMAFGYANGSWHIYKAGYWRAFLLSDREDLDRILQQLCPEVGLVFGKDASIIDRHLRSSMHFRISVTDFDAQPYIAMQNGTLNIETGELAPHSPEHMTTRNIDIPFAPGANPVEWEQIIDEILGDYEPEVRKQIGGFIQEWMGVALVGGANERTPRELRKALFLYGPPRAGKSTVYDVLRQLLGTDRIVASRVSEVNSRFGLEAFLAAQAWISEEVDDVRRDSSTSRVKCLITGEPITAQRKGATDVVLKFKGPVGWAGNSAPKFTEASNAVYDRIVVIPMERTFTADEAKRKFGRMKPVEWLYEKGEFPGIFNWALVGYKRLLERGRFEDIGELTAARDEWREENDPVYDFVRNFCEFDASTRNSAETIAWAAMGYIKTNPNAPWPSIPGIMRQLANTIPEAFPNVVKKRRFDPRAGKKRFVYGGLRLSEAGVALFQGQVDTVTGLKQEGLKANEKLLFGQSSSAE
jgi:P4 family phage/plasmid primase-like protien